MEQKIGFLKKYQEWNEKSIPKIKDVQILFSIFLPPGLGYGAIFDV